MNSRLVLVVLLTALCGCGGGKASPPPEPTPTENTAPTASIVSPGEGATLTGTGRIQLVGNGTDTEDGALSGSALQWSSSVDGALGTGSPLLAVLSAGEHRLSLDVTDSGGKQARAQISVRVVVVNQPPVALIEAPLAGASISEGIPILLRGSATDPEQGALSGASLTWSSSQAGVLGTGTQLTFTGAALGTHQVVLTAVDPQGLAGYTSVTFTVVPAGTNQTPAVSITQPASGAQLTAGQPLTLLGQATDPEDGALPDASLVWRSSRTGVLGTGRQVNGVLLSVGAHTLTLTGTDSMGASATASVLVTVTAPGDTAPVATITSPSNGYTFFEGSPLTLVGMATDAEDGPLTGASLRWSSSLSGELGTGSALTVPLLSRGTHQLVLTARDKAGNEGVASIQVVVLIPNAAPTVSITSPADGSHFTAGTVVALRGTASDPEDGPLSGGSLTWRSAKDGVLGAGAALDVGSLTQGVHQLTLSAMDSGGRVASASIQLTIDAAPAKLPPVARLTGPSVAEARQQLTFDGSGSNDPDGTLTRYRFNFGDGTPVVDGTATSVQHTYALEGSYTVTLTVTDNDNLTHSSSLALTVTPYVRRPRVLAEGPEQYGSECALVMRGAVAHLAFRNTTHPSLWYGTWDGTTWQMELVDGMGFNTGGLVESSLALALAADGTPHLAYTLESRGTWYATRPGATWLRERVDTAATSPLQGTLVSLALDPSQSSRPTLAYSWYGLVPEGSYFERTVIAYRTGPASWSTGLVKFPSAEDNQRLRGDIVFDAGGTLHVPHSSNTLGAWKSGSALQALLMPQGLGWSTRRVSLASTGTGPLVLADNGLHRVTAATPYSASAVALSSVENFTLSEFAVAVTSTGAPRIAVTHGGLLETMQPGPQGSWERTKDLDTVDSAQMDVAVDDQGQTRVCFFRAGKLVLY